jgi:hypothetical protein
MSSPDDVWSAKRAAENLTNSLASFFEENQETERPLSNEQKEALREQWDLLLPRIQALIS